VSIACLGETSHLCRQSYENAIDSSVRSCARRLDFGELRRPMLGRHERMGEISPQTVNAIEQAMARARAADGTGDKAACEQALAEVRRTLGR
jgi:hypothetical protein